MRQQQAGSLEEPFVNGDFLLMSYISFPFFESFAHGSSS